MSAPHILIIEARFYGEIADMLADGATTALDAAGATYERYQVPGVLEVPLALSMALAREKQFDGYVLLGCVIRGETSHYDIVANESARAVMDFGVEHALALGNGILTVETGEQAIVRADPKKKNKGADAANAALSLIALRPKLAGSHG